MAKYPLTEKQKVLLRSLISGLKDGTIEHQWIIWHRGEEISGIKGLGDTGELWRSTWKGVVTLSDLEAFIYVGLFYKTSDGRWMLNEPLILDAVENDFEVNSWFKQSASSNITLSGDFRGSNINVASSLEAAHQTVANSDIASDTKLRLEKLLQELNEALQDAPNNQEEDAEAIAKFAQTAADELATGKPNKHVMRTSLDGLKAAAEALGPAAPTVLKVASEVVKAFTPQI